MSHCDRLTGIPGSRMDKGNGFAKGSALLNRSRLMGRVSACLFLLAALALLDALQTLMRHEFNTIALIPGETALVSGMLPAGVQSHTGLDVSVEGYPGISFVPVETYKGFWMGGHMWRATLTADAGGAGTARVVIKDILPNTDKAENMFAGQQNPALIYAVTVWPSAMERHAADTSLFRRYTGLPAFGVAAGAVLTGILFGIANWFFFSQAERSLAAHGFFFIHGIKEQEPPESPGYRAIFAHVHQEFLRGERMLLLDRSWRVQGRGTMVRVDRVKGFAFFPKEGIRPHYGWLVAREQGGKHLSQDGQRQ